jgi:uncharacterized protein DUF6615
MKGFPIPAQISAPNLCTTFEQQSEKIWNKLKTAYHGGISRKEETITEDLLLDILDAHPSEVITWQFNSAEEAKVGADWEWWLTNGNEWLGLLIQAKKLDPKACKYKHIKHIVASTGKAQIDLLLDMAFAKGVEPLYLFYNYTTAPTGNLQWNCKRTLQQPLLGCTMAHATAVKFMLGQGGAGLPKMSKISLPFRCLVCCPMFAPSNASLPQRVAGFVDSLFARVDVPLDHPTRPGKRRVREQPPDYVRWLLETPPDERGPLIERLRDEVGLVKKLVVVGIRDRAAIKE